MNTLLGHALKPTPYQAGGPVSSGMAALRRLKSRQAASKYAQEKLDEANKKAGKSTLWGTIGGLAGGYALPALAGALGVSTGGLAIPLLAGLGTAGGAYFGKKKGYGEDVDIDEDMRYGGSQFLGEKGLDMQKLGQEEFTDAFARDSALKGLTAALTAGFSKGGGSYGKAAKFGQRLTDKGATGAALIPSYAQSFAMDTGLDTAGVAGEGALGGTGSILDMGGYGDLSSSISTTPVESGFTPSLSIPTEASNYGSVSDALNAPIFEGLKDEAIATAQLLDQVLPANQDLGVSNEVLEALKSLQSSKKSLEKSADIQSRLFDYYNSQKTNIDPQPIISFKDAFNNARKNNLLEFLYNNNLYNTQLSNN